MPEVDAVLTTSEVQHLLEERGVRLAAFPEAPLDGLAEGVPGDGRLFGYPGGAGAIGTCMNECVGHPCITVLCLRVLGLGFGRGARHRAFLRGPASLTEMCSVFLRSGHVWALAGVFVLRAGRATFIGMVVLPGLPPRSCCNARRPAAGTYAGGYLEYVFRAAASELFDVEVPPGPLPLRTLRNADFREVVLEVDGRPVLRFAAAYGFRNIRTLVRAHLQKPRVTTVQMRHCEVYRCYLLFSREQSAAAAPVTRHAIYRPTLAAV